MAEVAADLQGILERGLINRRGRNRAVADGTRTVNVCMTSGHHVTLAVKDNVFYGVLWTPRHDLPQERLWRNQHTN